MSPERTMRLSKGETMNQRAHCCLGGHEPDRLDLVQGNNSFALDLYAQTRMGRSNLFLSSYSLSLALVMAYAGARGDTARQMARALHFTLDQEQLHRGFPALEAVFHRVQAGDAVRLSGTTVWGLARSMSWWATMLRCR